MKDFGRRETRAESSMPRASVPKEAFRNGQTELDIPSIGRAKTLKTLLIYMGLFLTAIAALWFFLVVQDPAAYADAPIEFVNRLLE